MSGCSEDEKNPDGSEKEITYGEYVDKINRRALEEQKKIMQAKMRGQLKKGEHEDQWENEWQSNQFLAEWLQTYIFTNA